MSRASLPPSHLIDLLQRDHREPADQLHLCLVWELQGCGLETSAESGEDIGEDHQDPVPTPSKTVQTAAAYPEPTGSFSDPT